MRCLVTGASGHLGSYLVERLLDEGADVQALVRQNSDLWRLQAFIDRVWIIRADLSDVVSVAPAISQARPEIVFHLAWQGVTGGFKDDPEQITGNVKGSLDLFDVVRRAGCRCWIGVGSQAEYGPHTEVLTEDTPVRPVTAYGVAKLCVGLLTKKLCELSDVRYVWLRLLATYGPKDDDRHLIPSVIRHLCANERPSLTPSEQLWDYLYVEDAADAIYRAAVNEDVRGVFNLGSGEVRSIRSTAERIRDLIDPSLELGFGDVPYPSDQVMRLQTSIDRLRNITGWTPRVNVDEGLRRTVGWYREQRCDTAAQER
jgi:nucleoside-diphosphate-sugar epimerase